MRRLGPTKRLLKVIGGFFFLFVGVLLLVLPGPGWATIFLGLAMLASEFTWARRLLDRLKKTASAVRSRVSSRPGGRSA